MYSEVVLDFRFGHWLHENIAKGTTDPRVEFISQFLTQILIIFHLHNLDQAATSKSHPNISISTKLELQNLDQTRISTKNNLHIFNQGSQQNTDLTSASKS